MKHETDRNLASNLLLVAAGMFFSLGLHAYSQKTEVPPSSPASSVPLASSADVLTFPLVAVSQVTALQGYATDGKRHYTFSTSVITAYDSHWKVLWTNSEPFKDLPAGVTHVGDGEYSHGKLYVPVEHYESCQHNTLQTIAIYSAKNGALVGYHDISSYGHEISSATVVKSHHSLYVSTFCEPTKVYRYDLKTFAPLQPLTLQAPITSVQGISWSSRRKQFAVTSDSPDQKTGYVWSVSPEGKVMLLYTAPQRGEMEGVDYTQGQIRYLLKHIWYLSPELGRKSSTPLPLKSSKR